MKNKLKKSLCLMLAVISLIGCTSVLTSAAPQPRLGDPMYVTATGGLNVRKEPGLSSKIVGTLAYGTKVNVASYFGTKKDGYTWFKISSPQTGYVALEYLSYSRPASIVLDINEPSVG